MHAGVPGDGVGRIVCESRPGTAAVCMFFGVQALLACNRHPHQGTHELQGSGWLAAARCRHIAGQTRMRAEESTVAILAQGTSWAVAVTQAFCVFTRAHMRVRARAAPHELLSQLPLCRRCSVACTSAMCAIMLSSSRGNHHRCNSNIMQLLQSKVETKTRDACAVGAPRLRMDASTCSHVGGATCAQGCKHVFTHCWRGLRAQLAVRRVRCTLAQSRNLALLPRRVCCTQRCAMLGQHVSVPEQAQENTTPRKNKSDKQVSSWKHISCHTDKNRYYT